MVDLVHQDLEVSNGAMTHQANKHHCNLVVGNYAQLSTEHLFLVSGLSRKLASYFIGGKN